MACLRRTRLVLFGLYRRSKAGQRAFGARPSAYCRSHRGSGGTRAQIFGGRFSDSVPPELAFGDLERLVRIAYKTIRVEEDNYRPGGEAYSPDERDRAEDARSAAFNKLVSIPGRATFNALPRLGRQKAFPVPAQRLRELARWRAEQDSESAPWPPDEAAAFEASFQLVPQTPLDLQRLLFDHFDDWQHQLLNRDFAQGKTLASLPLETDVQNWVAACGRRLVTVVLGRFRASCAPVLRPECEVLSLDWDRRARITPAEQRTIFAPVGGP
jgi:hypothetical protein